MFYLLQIGVSYLVLRKSLYLLFSNQKKNKMHTKNTNLEGSPPPLECVDLKL